MLCEVLSLANQLQIQIRTTQAAHVVREGAVPRVRHRIDSIISSSWFDRSTPPRSKSRSGGCRHALVILNPTSGTVDHVDDVRQFADEREYPDPQSLTVCVGPTYGGTNPE